MVRLKRLIPSGTWHSQVPFGLNSTMVRLKHNSNFSGTNKPITSQFHYGSIKTLKILAFGQEVERLNSTMVRLKLNELSSNLIELRVSIPLWFD